MALKLFLQYAMKTKKVEKMGNKDFSYKILNRTTKENGFPYDCFFEWEYEMVEKAINAKPTLEETLDVIHCAIDYIMNNRDLKTET